MQAKGAVGPQFDTTPQRGMLRLSESGLPASKQYRCARNRSNPKAAEILIYDDIGESWFGGISAKQVAQDLKALGNVTEINVRINSQGGSVFDGFAIYNQLVRHTANIVVDVEGVALSAASVVAMAGNTIRMPENAWMMIHDPWTIAMGSADELRGAASLLDDLKGSIVRVYHARSGLAEAEIKSLMTEETWMDGAHAVELGFADEVLENLRIAAHVDRARFHHIPTALQSRIDGSKDLQRRLRLARNDRSVAAVKQKQGMLNSSNDCRRQVDELVVRVARMQFRELMRKKER